MDIINPNDHPSLDSYINSMTRIIKSIYPMMDIRDIEDGIKYSVQKRFKNFTLNVQNNYTNQCIDMTMLDMLDYIAKREPIITSYGTIFRKHEEVPNPMSKVIQSFIDLRKVHKKEMFKYPKNSEMFEHFNLMQALDKIDVNGIYGLCGLYISILFDLNVAPAVTSTGRSLISSAILCFEGFLGNNVKFGSLNDVLTFIDNVRMEYSSWKFNDFDILGVQGFVTVEECFNKIIMNCGYKYIPTEQDLDLIYTIIKQCNYIELNRLFYKNNLYSFMDLPIARSLMVKIITKMQIPYIEPAKPPKEILEDLNYLRDIIVEYVFYNHQYIDRMVRNKEMVKTISLVSDTDSSFVSLDAWYQYNIAYLKDYDCPIIHQQIDVFKMIEAEEKSEEWWWKDEETPEWYNAIDKTIPIKFYEKDEYGDFKDKSILNAIEFLDNEKDFDFYNEDIIEKQQMIDVTKIIPQNNMKFALINIMCYILSTIINLYMINFTKHSGSYRGDTACKINMKNEFYMSRILLTDAKKNYASLQILQEGNYLGSGVLDVKGIDCLTKSSTSRDTQKELKKILLNDILTGEIDQIKLIKDIAIFEKSIYNDLQSGSKKYYKPVIVKSIDNYETPMRIQGIKAAIAWNYIKDEILPGFDLGTRNPLDVVKVDINKKNVDKIKDAFPEQYERMCNILDPNCVIHLEGLAINTIFHGKLDTIGVPKDTPIPEWMKPFIDYVTIISNNLAGFPASSAGIGQFMSKKANYSNVIKL